MPPSQRGGPSGRVLTPVCAGVGALLAVVEIAIVVAAARHGFDLTDEGFYLNSIAHDSEGSVHVSSFGPVYRAVTWPLGDDITALRWFNVAVLMAAGAVLGAALLTRSNETTSVSRLTTAGLVLAVATSTLGLFGTGLLTPSYNSLAATGVLLVAAGLVLAPDGRPRLRRVALLAVALGGVITFLGKPSSALGVAVVAGVALVAGGPLTRRVALLAVPLAGAALLVVSWVMTGSPIGLVQRVLEATRDAQTMAAGHDLTSALTGFGLPETSERAWLLFAGLAVASFAWARAWLASGRWRDVWFLVGAAAAVLVLPTLVRHTEAVSYFTPSRAVVLLGAPAGIATAGLLTRHRPDRSTVVVAVSLLLLPHAWIFGSNNDYWHGASLLYVCWFLGGVVLLRHRLHAPAAVAVGSVPMLCLTAAVIAAMLAAPYRQAVPLFDQDSPTRVGPSSTLWLAPDFARAIRGFREESSRAGFEPGTPVIDLTGQTPGVIYALGGRAAGAPWIIGGYPGSDLVARRALSRTSCATLSRAWLLTDPGGTRSIDPSVLGAMGATVADWEPVSSQTIHTAPSVGRRIILLEPGGSPDGRRTACEAAR